LWGELFQAQAVEESRNNLGERNGFIGLKMEDMVQICRIFRKLISFGVGQVALINTMQRSFNLLEKKSQGGALDQMALRRILQ
jgi:hypothetical protein